MTKKFKTGDRVERIYGEYRGMEIGDVDTVVVDNGHKVRLDHYGDGHSQSSLKLLLVEVESTSNHAAPATEVKYILQYELEEDPFETFSTLKEVESRIRELADRSDLKRDSIVVYEVAKTIKVELDHKITMRGIRAPRAVAVKKVAKRAKKRVAKYATEQERKRAKARYQRKWYRNNKAKKTQVDGTPVTINKAD